MKKILLVGLSLLMACPTFAKIKLPALVGSNMVLQRECDANLWGWASPSKKVTVTTSWDGRKYATRADADGNWLLKVATPAAGGPYTIRISDGDPVTLENVMIGEVWVCSGQSNMEMPMRGFLNQPVEGSADAIIRAKAATPIRLCTVKRSTARTPQEECAAQWLKHTPEAVAGTSATAYYFARYLQSVLDVPVGVIVTCWGGTPVEAWMDRETMSGFKEFDLSFLDNPDQIDRPQYKPCGLYNGMIAPLVPYTVKGFLWYQGESNRPNPTQYRALMPAFVKMLRERWAQGGLPFYYVQIAPYRYDGPNAISGALLREAQLHNLKDIPSSGMAVTLDIGDEGCIHPAKKEEVGTRLAWLALSKTYGMKGIDADTPVCEKMEVADGKAYLTFATGPDGLAPYGRTLTGFEMAGADRAFHPATARIEKGKSRLIVACDAVPEPVAVRYAFRNVPEATLFNTSGIPASSFRTDDWEVK